MNNGRNLPVNLPVEARASAKQRRARKACESCHVRKTKCDLQDRGVPCTNCVELAETCKLRVRKNARTAVRSAHSNFRSASFPASDATEPVFSSANEAVVLPERTPVSPNIDSIGDGSLASHDFAALTDLDDIFSFNLGNQAQPFEASFDNFDSALISNEPQLQNVQSLPERCYRYQNLDLARHRFLFEQGCLSLPPTPVLRQLLLLYCRFIHPNLPLLDENRISELWGQDGFSIGEFPWLLLRCIMFSVVHLLDDDMLVQIGFTNKRDARTVFYNQAKDLFSFEVETDPIAYAQACLLLTYYAPNYNVLRVNTHWLMNSIRYAKLAEADCFYLVQDPDRRRILKRLWWCILFRDRILSLGLRRSLSVAVDPHLLTEAHILYPADFEPELGKSQVHPEGTQHLLLQMIGETCRLVQSLTPALEILFHRERLEQRVAVFANSPDTVQQDVHRCLEMLEDWHRRAISIFPSPIALDNTTPASLSIFANMLFIYHSSAVASLHQHLLLLGETVPLSTQSSPDESVQATEIALEDTRTRLVELLQMQLARHLPISVSAFVAPPLLLQSINVAAARGFGMRERVEGRKLEVFTRILDAQRLHFDGSDCVAELLSSIIRWVRDEDPVPGSDHDKRERQRSDKATRAYDWPRLVQKRPRLLLRLLYRLDGALCTGGGDSEAGFPLELRR